MGVEVSLLNRRLDVELDLWLKDTKDLLNRKVIPNYAGGGTIWVNQGQVKNKGVDFMVTAVPVETGDFSWESSLTGTYVENRVVDLAGEEEIPGGTLAGLVQASSIMKVGRSRYSFWLFDWAGVNEQTGMNMYRSKDGKLTDDPQSDDRIIVGQSDPAWTLGWNNTLVWKNFELNAFFNVATGYQRLNVARFAMSSIVGASMFVNLHDAYFKNWDVVGNKADAKYQSLKQPGKAYGNSTQYLENASFLKFKNVSLAYRIPRSLTKIADIKVSLSAQNIFTLTKYTGYDPETNNSLAGVDNGAYPLPREYTLGVGVTF